MNMSPHPSTDPLFFPSGKKLVGSIRVPSESKYHGTKHHGCGTEAYWACVTLVCAKQSTGCGSPRKARETHHKC